MLKKDFKARLKTIKEVMIQDAGEAIELYEALVDDLHIDEQSDLIIELFDTKKIKHLASKSFYSAYYLSKKNRKKEAKQIYENILEFEPNNSAVLNNLAIIIEKKYDLNYAYELIEKAFSLTSDDDDIISSNYKRIKAEIEAIEKKDRNHTISASNVENENSFVRNKLKSFFTNVYNLEDFDKENNTVPIANYQFKVLMRTDETKADSLKNQWLDKGYILNTGERNEFRVIIYEINPYIINELENIALFQIDETWINGINAINKDNFNKIGYYKIIKKLNKTNKKFRIILIRDFNEFIISYLFENYKSVIVLAGSLVETLLIYYLEKSKIINVEYTLKKRQVSKKLYESHLGDLLNYLEENSLLAKQTVHLGNVTRLYRNYIHPGKELRDSNNIDKVKADLCFNSVSELISEVIR